MKSFATAVAIRAGADIVWALLTDASAYPQWNSTVEKIDGRIVAGGTITVHTRAAPGRAFALKVTAFAPPQRMVWAGGMPLGLFTGTRSFTATPNSEGAVEFAMREDYSGLLAPLIVRWIPDLQLSFDRFATDLKGRAEGVADELRRRE